MGSTLSTSIAPSFLVPEFPRLKVSAVNGDAHGGEDASNGKCETDEAYRHLRWNFRSVGVDIILDEHSEVERRVRKERDQEQHHENSYERRLEPGDEGIV